MAENCHRQDIPAEAAHWSMMQRMTEKLATTKVTNPDLHTLPPHGTLSQRLADAGTGSRGPEYVVRAGGADFRSTVPELRSPRSG